MTAPSARTAIRIPGEIWIGVTSLTVGSLGGTRIGLFRGIEWDVRARYQDVVAEEFGGQTTELIWTGDRPVLMGVARGWDADAVANLFPQAALVSGTSRVKVTSTVNAATRAGTLRTATNLLFLPRAYRDHPALLLYRAVPARDRQQRMKLATRDEHLMPVAWTATPDDQGRTFARGMLEDLSL